MKTRKEWIEQRARALNQMEDMQKRAASEGRAMNDDDNKQWDAWDREFEEANAELGKRVVHDNQVVRLPADQVGAQAVVQAVNGNARECDTFNAARVQGEGF